MVEGEQIEGLKSAKQLSLHRVDPYEGCLESIHPQNCSCYIGLCLDSPCVFISYGFLFGNETSFSFYQDNSTKGHSVYMYRTVVSRPEKE